MLSIDWSPSVLYFVLYVFSFKFGMHFIFPVDASMQRID